MASAFDAGHRAKQVDMAQVIEDDPLWYKDAIIYEAHVRAFMDSNADGMGDFKGLAQKLDYLQDLGITAIWLLPFFPSPWKDDGYDISDFRSVHPAYGTLKDFQQFVKEAHRRGIRVITELVINHTSDQHEWFQKSRRAAPGSSWRDFYVWSDSPDKYQGVRIIFKDFEPSNWSWDPVAKAYYWHRFFSHQPDLNFDNPTVRRTVMHLLDYWAEMGVDGFRLDAIPYLFEREGTSCENLPETHVFLKELRKHLDEHFPNRMLLSEANMWPEDAVAYMGKGDECHMNFHFPLMPRLFMALRLEDRLPIVEILNRTPALPENCQWAMFLRNHDELTLEMVTDEERDYMYRMYASDQRARINLGIRRRLAPLLQNDRPRIEVMNALLFSMPGTPVIYYGDEIGMGDNVYLGDRNGVRTPMQWSPDRNAGFSSANPQQLYLPVNIDPAYHYEAVNVESQQSNPHSLLNWTKRLIALRKKYKAFGRGTLEFLYPANQRILAYIRKYGDETILVVANLSRFAQPAQLDLTRYAGWTPVEMFGRADFPTIEAVPYSLTLGPNSFYWFSLEQRQSSIPAPAETNTAVEAAVEQPRRLNVITHGSGVFDPVNLPAIAVPIAHFLPAQRWFQSKERRFRAVDIAELITVVPDKFAMLLVRTDFTSGDPETYLLPVGVAPNDELKTFSERNATAVIAELTVAGRGMKQFLYDATASPEFLTALLDTFTRRKRYNGHEGVVHGERGAHFRRIAGGDNVTLAPSVYATSELHTSIRFGDKLVLTLLRKIESGIFPAAEMGEFLTEKHAFPQCPPFAGTLIYQPEKGTETATIGVLNGYVANEGDAWQLVRKQLGDYLQRMQSCCYSSSEMQSSAPKKFFDLGFAMQPAPAMATELLNGSLDLAAKMGERLAEMHLLLASDRSDPAFAPEPFNDFYRQGLYQGNIGLTTRRLEFARQQYSNMGPELRTLAEQVVALEASILQKFRALYEQRVPSQRTRFHGRMHLGHVLVHQEGEVSFFDFGGDPYLHISERRIKRCPLRDVATMLMSFGYAAMSLSRQLLNAEGHEAIDRNTMRTWTRFWFSHMSAAFLRAYFVAAKVDVSGDTVREQQQILLDNYLLERALLDVRADIVTNPNLAPVPFRVILHLLNAEG